MLELNGVILACLVPKVFCRQYSLRRPNINLKNVFKETLFAGEKTRVGHRVLFRSERSVLFCSFKEHNILFRSFFEFLATYETLKNDAFFSILFLRAEKNPKNAKNATFFCKKSKRMPEWFIFCKRTQNVAFFFQYIYIHYRL